MSEVCYGKQWQEHRPTGALSGFVKTNLSVIARVSRIVHRPVLTLIIELHTMVLTARKPAPQYRQVSVVAYMSPERLVHSDGNQED
jgi:hypothetical protein